MSYIFYQFSKKMRKFLYLTKIFFYENWNSKTENKLIEFILALENIEIIQNINFKKNNLISIRLEDIFKEYSNKNLALVLIEEKNSKIKKIFLKSNIMGNNINKSILIEDKNINQNEFYEYIITKTQKEIIHLIKSQNLIDIKTPSFINTQFYIDKKNSLVELKKRIKEVELIEHIYVQEFNNEYVNLKIKYLGKINKIIKELKNKNIILQLIGDQWRLKII